MLLQGKFVIAPPPGPVATLLSPADADRPWFDLDVPDELTVDDKIEVQYGTSSVFSGATSVETTLTQQQASYAVLDKAQAALTDATTYYFRFRTTIGGNVGSWSDTETYTVTSEEISQASAVGSFGYTDGAFNNYLMVGRNFDLGPPDAGRHIVAAIGGTISGTIAVPRMYVNTDKEIAAANYVGTELTHQVTAALTSNRGSRMHSGVVAAGRSARVMANMTAGQHVGMCVAKMYALADGTPAETESQINATPIDPYNIGAAFTMPTDGFAIAFAYAESGFSSRAWQNSFSEIAFVNIASARFVSMGLRTASGSTQAAINRTNNISTNGVVAAWA